ncbi:hypothetical protein EV702DRAFT_1241034 [Suillus placidus]|uniref:Uncharacterized protein n=1 Tax=Suillus placidus TaxID=48579 RepID=A0A9P6ZPM9_9AGAM|nr:hypothetical protein EV702DRAFT_1241034 [Suillus placidus]
MFRLIILVFRRRTTLHGILPYSVLERLLTALSITMQTNLRDLTHSLKSAGSGLVYLLANVPCLLSDEEDIGVTSCIKLISLLVCGLILVLQLCHLQLESSALPRDPQDHHRAHFIWPDRRQRIWLERYIHPTVLRARLYSLELALNCYLGNSTKLRSLLQPYINQISSFSIRCHLIYDDPEPLLKDLPALQELIVVGHLRTKRRFSQLLPTLSSVKIRELDLLLSCKPVCANLTNVEIPISCPDQALRLLRLCPNLCSLAIRAKFDQTVIFKPLVHIKIQELRIIVAQSSSPIDIYDSIPNPLPGLLDAFSLPNLRTLEIRGVPWPHGEFKSFLTRSNCPLETVILGAELKIRRRQRAECVALIPSLQIIVSQSEAF